MTKTLPGRAVTDAEKRAMLKRLRLAWLANPELRLGQLLVVATQGALAPLFYIEDDVLAGRLDQCRRR
jgi:hypothetical protein